MGCNRCSNQLSGSDRDSSGSGVCRRRQLVQERWRRKWRVGQHTVPHRHVLPPLLLLWHLSVNTPPTPRAPRQEYTNYHFDVAPAHLQGALDRLAQFFVKPLFLVRLLRHEGRGVGGQGASWLGGAAAVHVPLCACMYACVCVPLCACVYACVCPLCACMCVCACVNALRSVCVSLCPCVPVCIRPAPLSVRCRRSTVSSRACSSQTTPGWHSSCATR